MTGFLLSTHSVLRYLILIMLICSLVLAWSGWSGNRSYGRGTKRIHQLTRLLLTLQMLLGFGLYYLLGFYRLAGRAGGLPDKTFFFTIVHVSMMLMAIVLINAGYSVAQKAKTDKVKYRRIAIFYSIGTLIIFMAIPWPFLHSWATWL